MVGFKQMGKNMLFEAFRIEAHTFQSNPSKHFETLG